MPESLTNIEAVDRRFSMFLDYLKMRFAYIPPATNAITAAADAGGGLTTFSSAGDYAVNDIVTLSTFITNTAYNDDFEVVSAVPGVSFTVAIAFGSTEAGLAQYLAAHVGKLQYVGRAQPGIAETEAGWIMHRHHYDAVTNSVGGQNFACQTVTETNQPGFKWSDRETFTYGS